MIADGVSRKLSIILGFSLVGCGFILEGSVPSFLAIAIAQVIWGLGYTCISGALDAWVIDETENEALFISGAKNSFVGQFIGIVVSVALAKISLNTPIIFGGLLLILLSILLIFFMTEKPYKKCIEKYPRNYLMVTFNNIFSILKTNHTLTLLFVIELFFGLYSEGYDRLWGAYILQTREFLSSNGTYIFGAIAAITSIIGYLTFSKIEHIAENTNTITINRILIYLCCIVAAGLCLITTINNGYILMLLIIIINLSRNMIEPFENIWFNNLITDSTNRATLISIKGQLGSLGQIGSGPLMGMLTVFIPVRFIFIISAVIFSPVIFIFDYLKKNIK